MNNKQEQRPLRSIFLLAAEMQADHALGLSDFSCINISDACCQKLWNIPPEDITKQIKIQDRFYRKFFYVPGEAHSEGMWWPHLGRGEWDHESRILALLLAAEMLRR